MGLAEFGGPHVVILVGKTRLHCGVDSLCEDDLAMGVILVGKTRLHCGM